MLTDAISSEGYKLWRNRTALFWGFLFTPFVALLMGVGSVVLLRMNMPDAAVGQPTDIGRQALMAAAQASAPLTILFALLGGAVLFAGDYRWETWRLIAPRNSRLNHIAGKGVVFALAALATVLAITLAGVLAALFGAFVNKAPIEWHGGDVGTWLIVLGSLILTSWLQLLQAGALVALVAVVTRSMMAAVMVPLFIGLVQAIAQSQLPGPEQMDPTWWRMLLLPGLATDLIRAHVGGQALAGMQMISPEVAGKALGVLALWILGAFAAAWALFQRQDLSKE